MDCSWPQGNNACDGGLDSNAYDWMLEVNGGKVAAAEPYGGYKNADGACHAADGFHAKITGYVNVTGLPAFNDALANVGPLSISIDATPEDFYYYKSGFYYSDDCKGASTTSTTVLAVGVKVHGDQRYTIVKNSWSTHWGDAGYVYISQKNNCCGVATAATYPTIA
ncbi:transferase [Aureococcus anophagefferens]|nr:transferase [Aureococcus anophagefferens]